LIFEINKYHLNTFGNSFLRFLLIINEKKGFKLEAMNRSAYENAVPTKNVLKVKC